MGSFFKQSTFVSTFLITFLVLELFSLYYNNEKDVLLQNIINNNSQIEVYSKNLVNITDKNIGFQMRLFENSISKKNFNKKINELNREEKKIEANITKLLDINKNLQKEISFHLYNLFPFFIYWLSFLLFYNYLI